MSLLSTTKTYMKVEGTESDTEIGSLITAARFYLQNAGADAPESNPLYALAVGMLVLHWFDNRGAGGTVTEKLKYSLDAVIQQLKYCNKEE